MSGQRIFATTQRVLCQLRHDHRTLALVFLMPSVLIIILYYVFADNRAVFNSVAPLLLGIIPFILMFIVASVAVLRERTSGTLERLLTLPVRRLDVLLGYALAFALLALVQSTIVSLVATMLLDVTIQGSEAVLVLVAVLAGVLGMSFGLLFSAFAKNEFQAVQFMPAFVLPQFLTCGLFIPREQMATALQYFSDVMPITYVVKALQEIAGQAAWTGTLTGSLIVIGSFIVGALLLGGASLRK